VIVRAPRPDSNFYILNKEISEDKGLSWGARGLLVYLLGKPDNWTVSIPALVEETKLSRKQTGRDGIHALLAELIDAGYIARSQSRSPNGVMGPMQYTVSEEKGVQTPFQPQTGLPCTVQPCTANPQVISIETTTRTDVDITPTQTALIESLPAWVPSEAWEAFLEMRKKAKARNTPYALTLLINKLDALRRSGNDPQAVLEQSIENSWKGVFPLRRQTSFVTNTGGSHHDTTTRRANVIAALTGGTAGREKDITAFAETVD